MSNMYYGLSILYTCVYICAQYIHTYIHWHNLRYRCGIPESQFWRIVWEAGGLFKPWVKSNCFQRNNIDDTAASWRDHVSTFRSPPVKSTPSPQQTACFSASERRQWMCARETTENLQILKVSLCLTYGLDQTQNNDSAIVSAHFRYRWARFSQLGTCRILLPCQPRLRVMSTPG